MRIITIQRIARKELLEAATWYEQQESGLAQGLLQEFEHVLDGLEAFPEMWPLVEQDIRRCPLKRFPYSILYRVLPEEVTVLAVMHHKRSPEHWIRRC